MMPIKVNADYEFTLFYQREAPKIINHSIEFLALYLEELPLYSTKTYHQNFLRHVEELSGHAPIITQKGKAQNWWGQLQNLDLERKLNSKEFSSCFSRDCQIITSIEELNLIPNLSYIAKNPYSMSGQDMIVFRENDKSRLSDLFKKVKKIIVQPFYDRAWDFSHYILPNGELICYENMVDEHFQYRGTIFSNLQDPTIYNLPFFHHIPLFFWENFLNQRDEIIKFVQSLGGNSGFSLDSFIYREDGENRIYTLCEINYRKTMGFMTWLLCQKFNKDHKWGMLLLVKSKIKNDVFNFIKTKVSKIQNCFYLSPGDTRFEIFLLTAESDDVGKKKYQELKNLLPDCQFPI